MCGVQISYNLITEPPKKSRLLSCVWLCNNDNIRRRSIIKCAACHIQKSIHHLILGHFFEIKG